MLARWSGVGYSKYQYAYDSTNWCIKIRTSDEGLLMSAVLLLLVGNHSCRGTIRGRGYHSSQPDRDALVTSITGEGGRTLTTATNMAVSVYGALESTWYFIFCASTTRETLRIRGTHSITSSLHEPIEGLVEEAYSLCSRKGRG
ncbi:unnamed protein product [Ectocarpus sp. 4 AP-2014]